MADNEKAPIFPVLEFYGLEAMDPGSGRTKVRCCFHSENRPSASVDVDKQRFTCFACGVSGDAIDIVMQQEGVSYAGALSWLEENISWTGSAASAKPARRELVTSLHISTRGPRPKRGDNKVLRARRGRKLR